ncbi:hypothetical protein RB598_000194 [Gaeumannomyces tritici]
MRIARELGGVFFQMLETRSSTGGRFVLGENGAVRITPLSTPTTNEESPCEWLLAQFSVKQANDPTEILWSEFGQMTRDLDAGGWFGGLQYSLAHLDLAPRNILVDTTSRNLVTGILDWDSALLAPCFMSCYPPLWIWAWQDNEDEDERTANDDPGTVQGRELKAEFEVAAGPDYVRLAYGAPYRLARRLVLFAMHGIQSNEDYKEAKAMLQEWAEVRSLASSGA